MEALSSKNRFDILDGLRGVAAISVMIYHFCQATKSSQLFENAPLAVDMFFMLSGFVLFYSYALRLQTGNLDYKSFLKKRVIRLYPMFLLGVILGTVCLILFPPFSVTPLEIARTTLLNGMFIPAPISFEDHGSGRSVLFPGNGPLWSIFFEMIASIAFLLLFRMSPKIIALIASISLVAYVGHTVMMAYLDGRMFLDFGNNGWSVKNIFGGFARIG